MNMSEPRLMPEMGEFNCSNDLIGDQAALKAAWERDGYWFFRDVLDKQAIAELRQIYMDYLGELGVADPGDPEARHNGADLSVMPKMVNETAMNERRVDRVLHGDPRIAAFFRRLFGCEPFWVPFTVHRQVPPAQDRSSPRLEFIHQDGTYNDGLSFLICWIPLAEITRDVGGLALVEGVHRRGSLHRKGGMKILPIAEADIEPERWRSTHYRPGDVLLMDLNTPHSGITNHSDRFRLSVDTRIMPSDGDVPVTGTIEAISVDGVTIDGRALRFDATSFVRGLRGDQMPLADVPGRYRIGQEVIAAVTGDLVRNMRPIQ
jgi:hypothetical protein